MKRLLLLLYLISFFGAANAQQLVQERLYKIGNASRSFVNSTLTREGNVALSGGGQANPGTQSVIAIIKPNTDTLWVRNGPVVSLGSAIKQAPGSGSYIFYTTKRYTSPTASGTILQKYDGNGQLKWTMPYQLNAFDTGYLLLSAPDSGYFLAGTNIINGKSSTFALSRTDSLGNLKWRKSFHWSINDFFADMQHTLNGNIVMYGITNGVSAQRLKLLLVNQNGDSVLGKILTVVSASRSERVRSAAASVTPLSDGGYFMAAEIDTFVTNAPPALAMVVKADANLNPVWHYINHSVPNNITFTRSRELSDGSVVVLAYERRGPGTPGEKFFLYRFSPAGALLNIYTFTSSIAIQVQTQALEYLAADTSFIIGGSGVIDVFPNFSAGYYVAKIKIPGMPPALPLPQTVTGIKPEFDKIKANLGQSYPNPAQAEAVIPFSLPKDCKKAVITINEVVTGRQVKSYALKAGETSLQADLNNLSNGIYTYTLLVDGKPVATKRLSVIR